MEKLSFIFNGINSINIPEIAPKIIICNESDILVYRKLTKPISKKHKVNFKFKIQQNPVGGIA